MYMHTFVTSDYYDIAYTSPVESARVVAYFVLGGLVDVLQLVERHAVDELGGEDVTRRQLVNDVRHVELRLVG